jgi:mycoredoxin-dependent peroxiredoxin
MPAEVGQAAPDFSLRDQGGNTVTLNDLKGKKSLIVFIPFPHTGNCNNEACALRDDYSQFENAGANVIIITPHAGPLVRHWAEENNIQFPVLSDYWPHGAVAQTFGSFNEQVGTTMRATYVLDKDGVVRDIIKTDSLGEVRDHSSYQPALAALD